MRNEKSTQNVIGRILNGTDHLEDLRVKGRALLKVDLLGKWDENVD
jgi:hypothetical protein